MNILREDAIYKLANHTSYRHNDTEILEWENGDPPTEEEIETKRAEMELEWIAQDYARNRATEYPALAEQLDEIYHNGINAWKAVIKVTKDKYPKG